MKSFILVNLFLMGSLSWGQSLQNYFSIENREANVNQIESRLLLGCPAGSALQSALTETESIRIKETTLDIFKSRFKKEALTNPKIFEIFEKDVNNLKNCDKEGNTCRSRIFSLAYYYFQNLRPELKKCTGTITEQNKQICNIEKANSNANLIIQNSDHLKYEKELNRELDFIFNELERKILARSGKNETHYICSPNNTNAEVFSRILNLNANPNLVTQLDPNYTEEVKKIIPVKKPEVSKETKNTDCSEKLSYSSGIIQINFDEGKSEISYNQNKYLISEVKKLVDSHPDLNIKDVEIVSSSSKTPFSPKKRKENGKFVWFTPSDSNQKNLDLADARGLTAKNALKLKKTELKLDGSYLVTRSEMSGPEFEQTDYDLKQSERDKKFKKYQGFIVTISGNSKTECSENQKKNSNNSTTKPSNTNSTIGSGQQ